MTASVTTVNRRLVAGPPAARRADDEPLPPAELTILRGHDPRIEHHPSLAGTPAASRIGGYHATVEQGVDAAELLGIDVLIPAPHPLLGYWLAPLRQADAPLDSDPSA